MEGREADTDAELFLPIESITCRLQCRELQGSQAVAGCVARCLA
jgi:hypothetical protein